MSKENISKIELLTREQNNNKFWYNYRKGVINPKTTGGKVNLTPCGFSKNVSSKEMVKPWFFVTFNIIARYIFPGNFIEIPQVIQKI